MNRLCYFDKEFTTGFVPAFYIFPPRRSGAGERLGAGRAAAGRGAAERTPAGHDHLQHLDERLAIISIVIIIIINVNIAMITIVIAIIGC